MARPSLPCEQIPEHNTHILIVGAGFAGLAFARVLQWNATHIEISDEGAVAAGDIKLAGALEVFEACELPRQLAAERGTYSREELRAARELTAPSSGSYAARTARVLTPLSADGWACRSVAAHASRKI